jgi:hypothetical protein
LLVNVKVDAGVIEPEIVNQPGLFLIIPETLLPTGAEIETSPPVPVLLIEPVLLTEVVVSDKQLLHPPLFLKTKLPVPETPPVTAKEAAVLRVKVVPLDAT